MSLLEQLQTATLEGQDADRLRKEQQKLANKEWAEHYFPFACKQLVESSKKSGRNVALLKLNEDFFNENRCDYKPRYDMVFQPYAVAAEIIQKLVKEGVMLKTTYNDGSYDLEWPMKQK